MGTLADIISMVKDLKNDVDSLGVDNFNFKYTRNSISRGSANGIMQFPVLTSNALSMDDLTMITKALEREYAAFVRVMVSMDDVIDLSKGETKLSKIKSIHQNMGVHTQGSIGMKNGSFFAENQDLRYTNIHKTFEEKNIELLSCYSEDLNMTIINDMTIDNNDNYYHLSEAKGSKAQRIFNRAMGGQRIKNRKTSAPTPTPQGPYTPLTDEQNQELKDRSLKARTSKSELDLKRAEFDAKHMGLNYGLGVAKNVTGIARDVASIAKTGVDIYNSVERQKWDRDDRKMQSQYHGVARNELVSSDVKKANELVPTLLDISLYYANGKGPMQETNVVIGIKAVSHLVNTDEMITAIAKGIEEKRSFFRFIQWTTGEISTWKDYILCVDRLRDEAAAKTSNSSWWRRLKNRATIDKLHRFSKKDIMPNTTLVLTIDEVEYIKNNYNIDLLKNKQAVKTLFNTFFLLGLVIVDPMSEMAYFMFDGRTDFEVQSYRALERETNGTGDIKSIISLIDRTR